MTKADADAQVERTARAIFERQESRRQFPVRWDDASAARRGESMAIARVAVQALKPPPQRFDAEVVAITMSSDRIDALRQSVALMATTLRGCGYSAGIDRLTTTGSLDIPESAPGCCDDCPMVEW